MSTLKIKLVIKEVTFDDKIYIGLSSGDVLAIPYDYTPRLAEAEKKELLKYHLIGGGIGIHFDTIDEDISLNGIIKYKMKHELLAS